MVARWFSAFDSLITKGCGFGTWLSYYENPLLSIHVTNVI